MKSQTFTKSLLECLWNLFWDVYEISSKIIIKSLLKCLWNLPTGIKRHKACPSIKRPTRFQPLITLLPPPNCVSKSHTTGVPCQPETLFKRTKGKWLKRTKELSYCFRKGKENALKFELRFSGDLDDGTRPKVQVKGQRAILTIERNHAPFWTFKPTHSKC